MLKKLPFPDSHAVRNWDQIDPEDICNLVLVADENTLKWGEE